MCLTKKSSTIVFNIGNNNNKKAWAANHNRPIRIISEGLFDTADWNNDAENFSFPSQEYI